MKSREPAVHRACGGLGVPHVDQITLDQVEYLANSGCYFDRLRKLESNSATISGGPEDQFSCSAMSFQPWSSPGQVRVHLPPSTNRQAPFF